MYLIFSDNGRAVKLNLKVWLKLWQKYTSVKSEEDGLASLTITCSCRNCYAHAQRPRKSLCLPLNEKNKKTRLYLRHWTTNPSKTFGYDKRPHESQTPNGKSHCKKLGTRHWHRRLNVSKFKSDTGDNHFSVWSILFPNVIDLYFKEYRQTNRRLKCSNGLSCNNRNHIKTFHI